MSGNGSILLFPPWETAQNVEYWINVTRLPLSLNSDLGNDHLLSHEERVNASKIPKITVPELRAPKDMTADRPFFLLFNRYCYEKVANNHKP